MKTRSATTLVAVLAAAAFWATPVMAQHDHGDKAQPGHDDGHAHGAVAKAKTFAEAAMR